MLAAHIQRLDAEALQGSRGVSAKYVSLSNALTKVIRALGVEGPAAPNEHATLPTSSLRRLSP